MFIQLGIHLENVLANATAVFAIALALDCPVVAAFTLAFVFDTFAIALALAFDSNAFD